MHDDDRALDRPLPLQAPPGETTGREADRSTAETGTPAAMQALKERAAGLSSMLQSIGEAVIATDREGRVTEMNPAAEGITGWPLEEARGKSLSEVFHAVHAKTHAVAENLVETVLRTERAVAPANHRKLIARDGREFQITDSAAPIREDGGAIRGVVVSFSDSTEQYAAREALRESEERWQFALEGSGHGVWDRNVERGEIFFSRRWKYLLGYDEGEIGNTLDEWEGRIHPEDRSGHLRVLDAHFRGEIPVYRSEYRLRCKDGGYKWILARGRVVDRDGQGRPRRVIGTHEDISERKQAEIDRAEALAAAREHVRRQKRHTEMLSRLAADLCLDSDDGSAGIIALTEAAADILEADRVSVWFYSEDGSELTCRDLYETSRNWHRSGNVLRAAAFSEYTAGHSPGRVIAVDDVHSDPRTAELPDEYFTSTDVASRLDAPLWVKGRLRAVLSIEQVGSKRFWLPEDEQLALTIGAYLSNYLEGIERWQAEENYRSIFENALEGIFQSTPEGRFLSVNPSMARMTGYDSPEDMIGSISNIDRELYLDPRDRMQFREILERDGSVTGFEAPLRRKDGSVLWVNLKTRVVRNHHGTPLYYEGTAEDITGRKEALEALRISEERYRNILDSMQESYYEVDLRGSLTFFNHSMMLSLGYPDRELRGKHFRRFTAREDVRKLYRAYKNVYETGAPCRELEWTMVTRDGTEVCVEGSISLIEDSTGTPAGFRGVVRNISDRRRSEEERERYVQAIKKSEEQYRLVMENINEAIWSFDLASMTCAYASPSVERLYGYAPEALIGTMTDQLYTPDGWRAAVTQFGLLRNGKIPGDRLVMEVEHQTPQRGRVWMEISVTVIRNDTGEVVGFAGVSRDISDRRQAEAERDQRLDLERRLLRAQKLESIGTLAGGIAHDFNNLLMGIQGYASLMLLDLDPSHPHHARIKHIEEQIASGANLTKQLLGFAQGDRYEVQPASMNEIVYKTAAMFGRTKKEVSLHHAFDPDLWTVAVDSTQMEQVFMNLYVNAWQAMPGGGDLYLATENVVLDASHPGAFELMPGRYVKVSVADTGVGMDERTRERIFDPFFSTKGMGRGTGLGLATVYGIVRGHQGLITVYSEIGQGSVFTIYLPATDQVPKQQRSCPAETGIYTGDETILLVDDEPTILEVNRELLESLGYRVYTAGSGQEAVALYHEKRHTIDLVILDMIMPGISGSETFNQLRKITPSVPVILSSGYSISGEAQTIMERGCSAFLQKPFLPEQLSQKIRIILDREKPPRAHLS